MTTQGFVPDECGAPARPTAAVKVAVVAGAAVCVALTLFGELQSPTTTARVALDVAVGLVSIGLLPVLFSRPVPAAVVLAALAAVTSLASPSSMVATVAVARTAPLRTAAWVAVLGAATHGLRHLWRPAPDLPLVWWLVLVTVAHAGLLAWGALSQSRAQVLASLRERARSAEADRDRMVREARAEERSQLAREMHDVLAHRLSLLATYAGALEYRPDAPPEKVAHAAGVVRAGVHQALDELRDVIGVLRYEPPGPSAGATAHGADSPVPGPRPGLDQLDALVAETRAAGSVVELVRDVPHGLPGLTGRTAYRVVQEGLTNARKHAAGHPVTVRVDGRRGAGLTVRVTNPVAAAPATVPGSSTGLIGLEERVRIVGGRLEHGTDGGQFRLQAWLPWQP